MELSFQRAKAVQNELILRGVDPRTIRLIAVGANEPTDRGIYDPDQRGQNRRADHGRGTCSSTRRYLTSPRPIPSSPR